MKDCFSWLNVFISGGGGADVTVVAKVCSMDLSSELGKVKPEGRRGIFSSTFFTTCLEK